MLAEAEDGLLLATVQVYSPPVVTVRVWVYCAVAGSFNTSLGSFSDDSGGVSGPRYSGGRSTSRDTGEGELRTGSIVVRVYCQYCYGDSS